MAVTSKCPKANHRILGIVIHIADGRKVDMHAQPLTLAGNSLRYPINQGVLP
jgi:hypothetical protein